MTYFRASVFFCTAIAVAAISATAAAEASIIERNACIEIAKKLVDQLDGVGLLKTKDQRANKYLDYVTNKFTALFSFRGEKYYTWDVASGETSPSSMSANVKYENNGEHLNVEHYVTQERTADFYASFGIEVVYEAGDRVVTISQDYDLDASCELHLHRTVWQDARRNENIVSIATQDIEEGKPPRPYQVVRAVIPTDDKHFFLIMHSEHTKVGILAVFKKIQSLGSIFIASSVQEPIIQLDSVRDIEAEHRDPISGQTVKMNGLSVNFKAKDSAGSSKILFAPSGAEIDLAENGNETWTLPFTEWSKGVLPEYSHNADSVAYTASSSDDEEPTAISVDTGAVLTYYENLKAYWSHGEAGKMTTQDDGKASFHYNLKGGGQFKFSHDTTYPHWQAPTNSRFLNASDMVQTDLPFVKDVAAKVLKKLGATAPATQMAAEIVAILLKNFQYDHSALEIGHGPVDLPTSELIKLHLITCQNYSNLFAAVARALGIPTRIVVGLLISSDPGAHAWDEIEVAKDIWLPLDPQDDPLTMYRGFYLPLFYEDHDTYNPFIEPKDQILQNQFSIKVTNSRPVE